MITWFIVFFLDNKLNFPYFWFNPQPTDNNEAQSPTYTCLPLP